MKKLTYTVTYLNTDYNEQGTFTMKSNAQTEIELFNQAEQQLIDTWYCDNFEIVSVTIN